MSEIVKELRIEWKPEDGHGEVIGTPCIYNVVRACLGCPNCRNRRSLLDGADSVLCAHPSFQTPEPEPLRCPACGAEVEIDETGNGWRVLCSRCIFYVAHPARATLERVLRGMGKDGE
jgi:DNA-directed RNA polymerase subunit RPC12/RpoP